MRKVYLADVGKLVIDEAPIPEAGYGKIRIKILRCGLCGTDVHNYYKETIFGKDSYPFNMGHEICGIVDQIGEGVKGFEIGDQVVMDPIWTCGHCEACHAGHDNNCENLTTIGLTGPSGNSEYTVAPVRAVVKTDQVTSPDLLAFTEPLATVVYGAEKLRISPMHDVLIVGAGPIGLLFAQLLKTYPVNSVSMADTVVEKLEFASQLGVKKTINVLRDEYPQKYDIVIDCTGSDKSVQKCFDLCRFNGQLLAFGVCPIDSVINIKPFDIYKKDLTIYASYTLTIDSFRKSLALIQSRKVDVKSLIAGVYPVGKLEECIQLSKAGKIKGKVIIDTTRLT